MLLVASNLHATNPRYENSAQLQTSTPLEASSEAALQADETRVEANGALAKP